MVGGYLVFSMIARHHRGSESYGYLENLKPTIRSYRNPRRGAPEVSWSASFLRVISRFE